MGGSDVLGLLGLVGGRSVCLDGVLVSVSCDALVWVGVVMGEWVGGGGWGNAWMRG